MGVNIESIPHLIVANIISKMSGISFKNAHLSARFISEIIGKYRNSIRIWLPRYELDFNYKYWLNKEEDKDLMCVNIEKQGMKGEISLVLSFKCQPGELFAERPEIPIFVFERLYLNVERNEVILDQIYKAKMTCNTLFYHSPDDFTNRFVRVLRPKRIIMPRAGSAEVHSIFNEESLNTFRYLRIAVDTGDQLFMCFEHLVPKLASVVVITENLKSNEVIQMLDLMKQLVQSALNKRNESVNQFLLIFAEESPPLKLADLIRSFLEIPHITWKFDDKKDNIFLFIRATKRTTIILYFQEDFAVAYRVTSSFQQFLDFFGECRRIYRFEVENEFDTPKKQRQLNFIKKKYFTTN